MSSTNSLTSRLEELRFRNPQSPSGDQAYTGYSTPNRYSGSFVSNNYAGPNDGRAGLTRRLTADSNLFNAFSVLNQQGQPLEQTDMNASALYKVQALEKKRMELEKTREQRKRFDAELEKFNRQQAQEERELHQMARDLESLNFSGGHQSEPTTPPEYRDPLFPSMYRRNRYSSASLVSPPAFTNSNRLSRSGSQLTSPPTEAVQPGQQESDSDKLPSKSVPGSRRGSSDKFSAYLPDIAPNMPRSSGRTNRYSMPATASMRQKRESVPEFPSNAGLGHIDTTKFLFGDDDELRQKDTVTTPNGNTFLQVDTTEDNFPILVRNAQQRNGLSTSSAALDLALSQSPGPDTNNGWPSFSRHRHSQHSLPQNVFDPPRSHKQEVSSPSASSQQSFSTVIESPTAIRKPNRHSMEASLASLARHSMYGQTQQNGVGTNRPTLGAFPSYSTNDIPTLKGNEPATTPSRITPPGSQGNQQFHNHNASLGRIPPGATPNRQSREFSNGDAHREDSISSSKHTSIDTQTNSTPFSAATTAASPVDASPAMFSSPAMQQYANSAYYGSYGMQLLNMGLSPMQMNGSLLNGQMPLYQSQQHGYGYQPHSQSARFGDSQAKVMQQRRMQNTEEVSRFNNAKIETYRGEIYSLCKDQHGCRFLQKQLETRNAETIQLIFLETQTHVVELMTDPFGNYLCQKLLEHSTDAQRTVLVNNAAPEMVKIALNQHGTRALQKMIEFISTPGQTQTVINSLKDKVVELIQDLNGNHVIQKCLNRLSSDDSQFIFDAVGANCVVVGTHRHGCCVLQRCIDHASGPQKAVLISQITQNAYALVQDPFGNYVLQYIVDLNDVSFTNPLCHAFKGNIAGLSKQKFSSNVIEKCIRHAEQSTTTIMVDEILQTNELEKMLRDSYANYVVQTALDFAERDTKIRLTEAIRPILPSIRGTPYGRRIQSKILSQSGDSTTLMPSPMDASPSSQTNSSRPHSGSLNPFQGPGAHNPIAPPPQPAFQPNPMMAQPGYAPQALHQAQGLPNGAGVGHFAPPPQNPNPNMHQGLPQFNRMPQSNGFNYF